MTIDTIGSPGSIAAGRTTERALEATMTTGGGRAPAIATQTANAIQGMPSLEQVNQAVSNLNQSAQAKSQGLEFSIDSDTQRTVVKVIDQSTKEVLRQIPTPEALDIAKALESKATKGVLIQQTA